MKNVTFRKVVGHYIASSCRFCTFSRDLLVSEPCCYPITVWNDDCQWRTV